MRLINWGRATVWLLPRNVFHKHRNVGDKPLKFLFISAMLGNGTPPGRQGLIFITLG